MHSSVLRRVPVAPVAFASLLALVACGPKAVPQAAGYEPLETTNKAALPEAMGGDAHPEAINVVVDPNYADDETGDSVGWAHGQGYIHASIKDVWAACQKVEVVADRRNLTSWSESEHNTDSTAHVSFHAHLVAKSFSVNYDTSWRERATEGTEAAPTTVVVRDELVQPVSLFGTQIMSVLSDSIILTKVDDTTTAIAVIRHLQVAQPQEPGQYLKDLHASIVAQVHGDKLPTY